MSLNKKLLEQILTIIQETGKGSIDSFDLLKRLGYKEFTEELRLIILMLENSNYIFCDCDIEKYGKCGFYYGAHGDCVEHNVKYEFKGYGFLEN